MLPAMYEYAGVVGVDGKSIDSSTALQTSAQLSSFPNLMKGGNLRHSAETPQPVSTPVSGLQMKDSVVSKDDHKNRSSAL